MALRDDLRRIKAAEVRAVLEAVKRGKRFVMHFYQIADALREVVGKDKYQQIVGKLYGDLVRSALPVKGVYTYRILQKPEDERDLELIVITEGSLSGEQLRTLQQIAKLEEVLDSVYEEFCECRDPHGVKEKGGAIYEVIHNLIIMWTGTNFDSLIDALESAYRSLSQG